MGLIAVIDTETNWYNEVMSVGVVAADEVLLEPLDCCYYILDPAFRSGGMYDSVLMLPEVKLTAIASRSQVMEAVSAWLKERGITRMFAYNARFDQGHLPELSWMQWHDIMRIAAYRQYNPSIPADLPCCSTGRLKRGYGVEPILQLLSGDRGYRETHHALLDARDELKIMKLLDLQAESYELSSL